MINISAHEIDHQLKPRITVFGVGGAGGNAVNNMIRAKLEGVDFVAANTDVQALEHSLAPRKLQLGLNITQGLGAGARPEIGRAAAEEVTDDIAAMLDGAHMVFIAAGMGGGTGTGAGPVIARMARESGILTVGVVTKPFSFEGKHRMRLAEQGIAELSQHVDTLIIIPNQNLFRIANEKTTFADAFRMADEVLHSGVRGVTDLIVMPGLINLDFADIRAVMSEMGKAMMGTGEAEGEGRAIAAAEAAINNPLLDDVSMKGARGVLINITGGPDLTLFEVDEAANRIRDEVDPDANIIFGSTFEEHLKGRIRVSVVATGIEAAAAQQPRPNDMRPGDTRPTDLRIVTGRPAAGTGEGATITAPAAAVAMSGGSMGSASMSNGSVGAGAMHTGNAALSITPAAMSLTAPPAGMGLGAGTGTGGRPNIGVTAMAPAMMGQPMGGASMTAPTAATPPAARGPMAGAASNSATTGAMSTNMTTGMATVGTAGMTTGMGAGMAASGAASSAHSSSPSAMKTESRPVSGRGGVPTNSAANPAAPSAMHARMTNPSAQSMATGDLLSGAEGGHAGQTGMSGPPSGIKVTKLAAEPPVSSMGEEARSKRGPSLFERVTGIGRKSEGTMTAEKQPKLDIHPEDRPSLSGVQGAEGGSLLDIPTFLRRQTN